MQWLANTAFGLEGQTNKDLKRLGIENTQPQQTGGVLFEATPAQAFAANLWLRCADRVMLVVGCFEALTFVEAQRVHGSEWHGRRVARDAQARSDYLALAQEPASTIDDVFMLDLMRRG